MSTPSINPALARSYVVYLVCSVVGLFADTILGFNVYVRDAGIIALICFVVGTILISWAQYTSRHHHKNNMPYYLRGPYRYLRNPTQLGLVFLVTGYSAISGSIVFLGMMIVAFIISNIFFRQYEAILDRTSDGIYKKYQAQVPKIF